MHRNGLHRITAGFLALALSTSAVTAQPAPTPTPEPIPAPAPKANPAPIISPAPLALPATTAEPAPAVPTEIRYSDYTGHSYSLCETVFQSIFPKHAPKREWTPLYCDTFFSEGWLEPHIGPPNGPNGSLRQGWVGVPDAFFNRQMVGIYDYARGANGAPNQQAGAFLIESPISRRWDVGFIVPFVDHIGGNGVSSATNFGDVTVENRFLLHETADLTVSLNLNIRTPTGGTSTGDGRTVLVPYIAFYKDLWAGWSVRAAAGVEDPVNGPSSGRFNTLFQSIGIGQTITPHDVKFFGDFTYYVCGNFREDLDSSNNAFMSITPGIRTHLGKDFFLLFGVDIPVTANAGFRERFNVILVKGF
jgi:hypothetical protein